MQHIRLQVLVLALMGLGSGLRGEIQPPYTSLEYVNLALEYQENLKKLDEVRRNIQAAEDVRSQKELQSQEQLLVNSVSNNKEALEELRAKAPQKAENEVAIRSGLNRLILGERARIKSAKDRIKLIGGVEALSRTKDIVGRVAAQREQLQALERIAEYQRKRGDKEDSEALETTKKEIGELQESIAATERSATKIQSNFRRKQAQKQLEQLKEEAQKRALDKLTAAQLEEKKLNLYKSIGTAENEIKELVPKIRSFKEETVPEDRKIVHENFIKSMQESMDKYERQIDQYKKEIYQIDQRIDELSNPVSISPRPEYEKVSEESFMPSEEWISSQPKIEDKKPAIEESPGLPQMSPEELEGAEAQMEELDSKELSERTFKRAENIELSDKEKLAAGEQFYNKNLSYQAINQRLGDIEEKIHNIDVEIAALEDGLRKKWSLSQYNALRQLHKEKKILDFSQRTLQGNLDQNEEELLRRRSAQALEAVGQAGQAGQDQGFLRNLTKKWQGVVARGKAKIGTTIQRATARPALKVGDMPGEDTVASRVRRFFKPKKVEKPRAEERHFVP